MRLSRSVVLGPSALVVALASSCSTPVQPPYADISYQTRCVHLDGTPIMSCTSGAERDIYGFNGDMGARFSCSITERSGVRTVNFSVVSQAPDGTRTGVQLANATVQASGGAPTGSCQFTWTDGNVYGGACGASAPTAAQPCQVRSINFNTDTATGLPLMDVNVICRDAPSMPATSPPTVRSVSAPSGPDDPFTIHFYSCPTR